MLVLYWTWNVEYELYIILTTFSILPNFKISCYLQIYYNVSSSTIHFS